MGSMQDAREVFLAYLKQQQLKFTPQRERILDVFMNSEGHLTAEELYVLVKETDPSIGQATVYRTVKLLADSGIAKELQFGDGVARFEHKLGHSHHDHLICESCGRNIEVVDERIEELQELLARKNGFRLTGHRMVLYGICPDCRKR